MPVINCPSCGVLIPVGPLTAKCKNCGWDSSKVPLLEMLDEHNRSRKRGSKQ